MLACNLGSINVAYSQEIEIQNGMRKYVLYRIHSGEGDSRSMPLWEAVVTKFLESSAQESAVKLWCLYPSIIFFSRII